jgi:hypothetical protein
VGMFDEETKVFKKGSILIGLSTIVISLGLISFIMIFLLNQNSEFHFSFYGILMIILAVVLFFTFIDGLIMLWNGTTCEKVRKSGQKDYGSISKLWCEEKNIYGKSYYFYYMKFSYRDEYGFVSEQEEKISIEIFERLHHTQMVPIIIYKERAIFDKKTFIAQNKDQFVKF